MHRTPSGSLFEHPRFSCILLRTQRGYLFGNVFIGDTVTEPRNMNSNSQQWKQSPARAERTPSFTARICRSVVWTRMPGPAKRAVIYPFFITAVYIEVGANTSVVKNQHLLSELRSTRTVKFDGIAEFLFISEIGNFVQHIII